MSESDNPQSSEPKKEITRNEAIRALWKRGNLTWKLDDTQKSIYTFIKEHSQKLLTLLISRRCGKTSTLLVIALEQCFKHKNSIVLYFTPEQKQTRTIVRPLLNKMLEDCPENLRPEYKTNESLYRFHNGSELRLVGTDNEQYESQRGIDSHLVIIDEAGFVKAPLKYIIQSILIPTTLHTRGKIILSSTPPQESDHPFKDYVDEAEASDSLIVKTIYDFPRISHDEINDIIKSLPGGVNGSAFRREFLCKFEVSDEINVIPEMHDESLTIPMIRDWDKPPYYDFYVGMDLGLRDATGILFAYVDYLQQKIIFVDEWLERGNKVTMLAIAKAVEEKEKNNFLNPISSQTQKYYKRVSDTDLIVLNDLNVNYKTYFEPAKKYDKPAIIAQFRHAIERGRIIISPKCKNLILQMKHARWEKNKDTYKRSEIYGHFDLVDAALYLFRSIDWKRNPYPRNYNLPSGPDVHLNSNYKQENPYEFVMKMFKPRFDGMFIKDKNKGRNNK